MQDEDDKLPPDESDLPPESEASARGFVADAVRKAVMTGLGAVFLTEEGARKLAREWKLPKEIVGYVVNQAGGAKDEIVRVVGEEVRKFFESEALRREFLRALSSMSIEVHAEVRLKPAPTGDSAAVVPEVKAAVKPRLRRTRDEHKPGS
jgi:hypothetical protein